MWWLVVELFLQPSNPARAWGMHTPPRVLAWDISSSVHLFHVNKEALPYSCGWIMSSKLPASQGDHRQRRWQGIRAKTPSIHARYQTPTLCTECEIFYNVWSYSAFILIMLLFIIIYYSSNLMRASMMNSIYFGRWRTLIPLTLLVDSQSAIFVESAPQTELQLLCIDTTD